METTKTSSEFYERKILRLENDIVSLNEELNQCRSRLRSAEDYKIKYELIIRHTQQENELIKQKEQIEKTQINEVLVEEIERMNQEWLLKIDAMKIDLEMRYQEEREELFLEIENLAKRNQQMTEKSEQMDLLLLKNKKIAKDLESLEDFIEQNRKEGEEKKEEELKTCKETLTEKYETIIRVEKEKSERIIKEFEEKINKLEVENVKLGLSAQENRNTRKNFCDLQGTEENICKKLNDEIDKLRELLKEKNEEIQELKKEKIEEEEKHALTLRDLRVYNKDLEEEIYKIQEGHETELLNYKFRMEEARKEEIINKQNECENNQKRHMKEIEKMNEELIKEKDSILHTKQINQNEITKLKEEKEKFMQKISELKNRLKEFETQEEMGETEILINSLKMIDKKEDELSNYENGIIFLEKQLKKSHIKIERKNSEIKELVNKISEMTIENEKEIHENKEKYSHEIQLLNNQLLRTEEEIKELNEEIRRRNKEEYDKEIQYENRINIISAENRSLKNTNSDLQRDYTRILDTKKLYEKSFADERHKSVTSKTEIATAKKDKWVDLERQRHEIEIIYKEKEEQLKTEYDIQLTELKVENDKLRRDKELLQQDLHEAKERIKNVEPKGEVEKENIYAEYHKKIATVNLEIALTENLYNSLLKTKSRNSKKIKEEEERKKEEILPEPEIKESFRDKLKISLVPAHKRKDSEVIVREYERMSSKESNRLLSSRGDMSEEPIYLDADDYEEKDSPTFKMMNSLNSKNSKNI